VNAKTSASATPAAAATASAAPSVAASTSAAPSVAATGQQTAGGNAAVKADPQKVQQVKQQAQQIKQQHANFRAQPRPDKVPAVTFNASYRIQGSDPGRVRNTKYSDRIIRNGTSGTGIIRVTSA